MELFEVIAWYVAGALAGMYSLWAFFLAVMALQRSYEAKTLSKVALVLGLPIIVTGFVIDFCVNVVVASVLFLELPEEATVSKRLGRLKREQPTTWRGKLASWFCANLLDTFDPTGEHCDC